MKKLLVTALVLLSSISFARFDVTQLVGSYTVQGIDVPYSAEMTLSMNNRNGLPMVYFIEKMGEDYSCKGFYSTSGDNEIDAYMYCGDYTDEQVWVMMMRDEEPSFSQNITLTDVDAALNESSFEAVVKSSLYNDIPVRMQFTKN